MMSNMSQDLDNKVRRQILNSIRVKLVNCTRSEHARIHLSKKVGDANENIQ